MTENQKVMVLGFDGCSYNILMPLIEKGKLPNFGLMMKEGVWGNLRSTIPPLSGPAWATFATGKNPGRHGIFDFFRNLPESYSCTPINYSFLPTKTFWEILSEQGKKVGIMNMLFMYPPPKVNGFIISGKETPSEDASYTYPIELKEEILSMERGYKAEPYRQMSRTRHFLKHIIKELKRQEGVNTYLLKKYPCDFSMSFYAIPDVIHHIFWASLDPTHPNYNKGDAKAFYPLLEECFVGLDTIVGNRLKMIDKDTILMIMSDHGAGPAEKIFQLNKWLQTKNLLFLKENYSESRKKSTLFLRNKLRLLMNATSRFDVLGLRRVIGLKTREKRILFARKKLIDWTRTRAYSGRMGEYGVHINLRGREGQGIVEPGEEYERLRDFVIEELGRLKSPENNESVFRKICKREELYEGDWGKYAPDLILDFGNHPYQPGDSLLTNEIFENIPRIGIVGMHREDGVLMAKGKGVKKGTMIEKTRIGDLAPTILMLMGAEIPSDMDGRIVMSMLEFPPPIEKIRYSHVNRTEEEKENVIFTEEEKEEISKRLSDLGYL